MKLLNLTILLFCLCSTFRVFGQASGAVSGKVKDENNAPLEAVTVALLRAGDSSLVKAAITDTSGTFEIDHAGEGSFLLSYSSMGYQKAYSNHFALINNEYRAYDLKLIPESNKIQDVVITSSRPMIEVKPGKIVFNVEGSINASGGNALELLQKSPGVMIDNDDNISMKGKNGVVVYIDGKMTNLDSKSLAEYLKSINSSDIEAIEMISNPGAKYDASGNAGIINIRLKKNKKFGTNGTAELGYQQGITPKGNAAFGLNYRDKKINIFGNATGYLGNRESDVDIYRIQNGSVYDQQTTMIQKNRNVNFKAGADYFLDGKNTIGVLATSGFGSGSFNTNGFTDIYDQASGDFLKKLRSGNTAPRNRTNANFNLNYRYADDSTGTEVSFDADYGLFRSNVSSYQPNDYYDAGNTLLYSVINGNSAPVDINIYTAKLDVAHKLGRGKLGYGAKAAFVKTGSAFDFFNYTDNKPVKDLSLSNAFNYTENVNAAYVNYDIAFGKKWNLQAGLRMEQTNSKGDLIRADGKIQDDNIVKRNYLNLFPNATLSYSLSQDHVLGITYSRRIDRPDYQDLNPFENKLDQLTYEKGNAFLKPQYTDNVELSYVFKSMVNFTAGYAYVRDYAVRITDTINGNATYLQSQNIASQKIFTFSAGSPLPIAKWWSGYANVWYNYQVLEGTYNDTRLDVRASSYGLYVQNTFILGKGISAEVSGWFNGPGLEETWDHKAMGQLDMGIQKRFLNDRASVKFSVNDVLATTRFRARTTYGGMHLNLSQQNERRMVRLTFTYRFGSSQIKAARQRKTASESEGNRIK